jgi:hypothetical protein
MSIIRDYDPETTQTFTIVTDIENNYGLVCAYTETLLTPSAYPYVSLSYSTITVDPLQTT